MPFCLFSSALIVVDAFIFVVVVVGRCRHRHRCRASPLFHLKTNAVMTVHGIRYIVHVWQCISNLMSAFCVSYHDYHFVGEFKFFRFFSCVLHIGQRQRQLQRNSHRHCWCHMQNYFVIEGNNFPLFVDAGWYHFTKLIGQWYCSNEARHQFVFSSSFF